MPHLPATSVVLLCALIAGCTATSVPAGFRVSDATIVLAGREALPVESLAVNGFELLLVGNTPQQEQAAQPLHIYLAGDGSPWRNSRIQSDPSPRQALALSLMLQDPSPSLLLGRPCYHGRAVTSPACQPALWTFGRYGETVLATLAAALRDLSAQQIARGASGRLRLIGFSGGGVLAMLLAQRLAIVEQVVTLGAPLDVARWSAHHGYTPLLSSLDPAVLADSQTAIPQLHLQAELDTEVPPGTTDGYFQRLQPDAAKVVERRLLPGATHRCCWLKVWPPEF